MKNNSEKVYVVIKIIAVAIFMYFYFNYDIFYMPASKSLSEAVYMCRGLSLILAVYTASSAVDTIYKVENFKKADIRK